MTKKIDITSTTLEKSVDLVRDFVDRLITPSVEELGLLAKDNISYWRFKNQVSILLKAKEICEKNGINPKALSPKILCPYLENAALEENEYLQNKWAGMLSNMVDSEKNLENHVFPYILGQLSLDEFQTLEAKHKEHSSKVLEAKAELTEYEKEGQLDRERLAEAEQKLGIDGAEYVNKWIELRRIVFTGLKLEQKDFKEYELANIVRLGLARIEYDVYGEKQKLSIPPSTYGEDVSVDFDLDVYNEESIHLTELGEIFIDICNSEGAKKV